MVGVNDGSEVTHGTVAFSADRRVATCCQAKRSVRLWFWHLVRCDQVLAGFVTSDCTDEAGGGRFGLELGAESLVSAELWGVAVSLRFRRSNSGGTLRLREDEKRQHRRATASLRRCRLTAGSVCEDTVTDRHANTYASCL